jgi:hypothetical protein
MKILITFNESEGNARVLNRFLGNLYRKAGFSQSKMGSIY